MCRWLDGISVRNLNRAYRYRPRTEPGAEGPRRVATSAFADFCSSGGSPGIGCPFGDRGPNSQPGTMPLGVIHQPGALAGQIAIQRPQGRPKLSRWRDGFAAVRPAPEMRHDRTNTIDAFPRVLRFPIPDPPVQSVNLRDDHGLRRRACRITCLQPVRDLFEVLVSGAKPRAACIFPLPPTRAGTIRLVHVTARR